MLFSVIIPHRDSLALVRKLLSTVPQRDDIEIIVVDNSLQPLDATLFDGVKNLIVLYSDVKKGAGHARNIGLQNARGAWVIFADADDYFLDGAFAIFREYSQSIYDIVYFGIESRFLQSGLVSKRGEGYVNMVFNHCSDPSLFNENRLRLRHFVPWGKMIKRDLVIKNSINFDEVEASNDIMFSAKIGWNASLIASDTRKVYCVTLSDNSLTKVITAQSNMARLKVAISYNHFVTSISKEEFQLSLMVYLRRALFLGPHSLLETLIVLKNSNINFLKIYWNSLNYF